MGRVPTLVTGLYRFFCSFGFDPCFKNGVACKRDVWRVGLRHPVNDDARFGQRIQDNVKGRLCFRGLAEAGIMQNHQDAEADQTSFHGSFRSTAITQSRELCSGRILEFHVQGALRSISQVVVLASKSTYSLDKKRSMHSFYTCPPQRAVADERSVLNEANALAVLKLRRVPG
jgi:hypothetical protein